MPYEKHGPRASVTTKTSASVFVYWVPRAMFFTRHGRPWSNPTTQYQKCYVTHPSTLLVFINSNFEQMNCQYEITFNCTNCKSQWRGTQLIYVFILGLLKSPATICLVSSKITIVGDFAVLRDAGRQKCKFNFLRSWMFFHVFSFLFENTENIPLIDGECCMQCVLPRWSHH